jgi:hypothetical protein
MAMQTAHCCDFYGEVRFRRPASSSPQIRSAAKSACSPACWRTAKNNANFVHDRLDVQKMGVSLGSFVHN